MCDRQNITRLLFLRHLQVLKRRKKAQELKKYFKTGSGHAILKNAFCSRGSLFTFQTSMLFHDELVSVYNDYFSLVP